MLSIREAISQGMFSSEEAKEIAAFRIVRLVQQKGEQERPELTPDLVWVDEETGELGFTLYQASRSIRNRDSQLIEYSAPERLFDDYHKKLGDGTDAVWFSLGLFIYYLYYGKSYYEQMRERVTDIPPAGAQKAQGSLIRIQDCGAMPKAIAQGVEQLTSFLGDRKRGISLIENFENERHQGEATFPEHGQKQDLSRLWIGVSVDGRNDNMVPILRLDGSKGLEKKIQGVQALRSIKFWKVDFATKQTIPLEEIQLGQMTGAGDYALKIRYNPDLNVCLAELELRGAKIKSWQLSVKI